MVCDLIFLNLSDVLLFFPAVVKDTDEPNLEGDCEDDKITKRDAKFEALVVFEAFIVIVIVVWIGIVTVVAILCYAAACGEHPYKDHDDGKGSEDGNEQVNVVNRHAALSIIWNAEYHQRD